MKKQKVILEGAPIPRPDLTTDRVIALTRMFTCPVCDRPVPVESRRPLAPNAPELLQAGMAWVAFSMEEDEEGEGLIPRAIVLCSEACGQRFLGMFNAPVMH